MKSELGSVRAELKKQRFVSESLRLESKAAEEELLFTENGVRPISWTRAQLESLRIELSRVNDEMQSLQSARSITSFSAPASGRLKTVAVTVGKTVELGDLVAEIEATDFSTVTGTVPVSMVDRVQVGAAATAKWNQAPHRTSGVVQAVLPGDDHEGHFIATIKLEPFGRLEPMENELELTGLNVEVE